MQMPLAVFLGGVRRRLYVALPSYYSCRHNSRSNRSGRIPHMNMQKLQTDTNGLKAGMADVAVTGGNMPVYFARPANVQNPPVILVCMEIFGLHEWVKDITRRVGHLGAFAIAPNYYFRSETGGVDLTKIEDMKSIFPIVNAKTDTELFADLDATVAWAKAQGGDTNRLGLRGFCPGGRSVWDYLTHNANLKAGVAFYGTLIDKSDAAPKSSVEL